MEILVLMMLALFLGIIAIAVVLYVIFKNNIVNRTFDKKIGSELDYPLDEDDYDDFILPNITLPINFNRLSTMENDNDKEIYNRNIIDNNELNQNININKTNVENVIVNEDNKLNDINIVNDIEDNNKSIKTNNQDNNNNNNIESNIKDNVNNETYEKDNKEDNSIFENNKSSNNKIVITTPKNTIEEVVNILVDKKNYIFLANNNKVSKNEHLKLIINNKICFGTVTKANYIRDISLLKVKPRKLIIVKNKTKKEIGNKDNKENEMIIDDYEFIPIKKKKD